MAAKMKLVYFDIRGLAEVTRLLFAASKLEYEDFRYGLTLGENGPTPSDEMKAAKESGELDANLGKLPILEVDGFKIGQSKPIERFVAKKAGLMGSNEVEELLIDSLTAHVIDIKDMYKKAKADGADDKEAAMKKWFEETLPEVLQKVDKSMPPAPGPWLVGSKMSLADITYYYFLLDPKGFFDDTEGAAKAMATAPKIKAACEATLADPGIAEWVTSKRPEGSAPF